MTDPTLTAALALVVVLAAALLITTISDRRRRGVQARLAEVTASARQLGASAGVRASLRRQTTGRKGSGIALLPAPLAGRLDAALAATGGRLTVSHLIIVAVIA